MGTEVERKFLVIAKDWLRGQHGVIICQCYISLTSDLSIRVRISGRSAWLTLKSKRVGISRDEFEYAIPVDDALALKKYAIFPPIEKTRYRVPFQGGNWDVDVFEGANAGLVLAEIEVMLEDEKVVLPDWVGAEVSTDDRYLNQNLSKTPYQSWEVAA